MGWEWYDMIGWLGVIILLMLFALNSFEMLKPSRPTHYLNIVGAACVGVSALKRDAYPATLVEVAWMIIAALAIIRSHFKKP